MAIKRLIIVACLLLGLLVRIERAFGQSFEVQQLLLNVEKLAQFKQIYQNARRSYQILNNGYSNIRDIAKGNYSVHKVFLDGLLQVSPEVRRYKRVAEVVEMQAAVLREYRRARDRNARDGNFSDAELRYMDGVYARLLQQSARNMEQFAAVMTAGKLRMSDSERIEAIDRIHFELSDMLTFLRQFNGEASLVALQRARAKKEIEQMQKLHR